MQLEQKYLDRFWSKVDKSEECWVWIGAKSRGGYGQFHISSKRYRATRLIWMLFHGDIPEGIFVCHTCDNPTCVNPEHLFLGTHKQNMEDKVKKGRQNNGRRLKTHCPKGHQYTEENTQIIKATGSRQCRTCNKERNRKWRESKSI